MSILDQINKIFEEALKQKDIARKNDSHLENYNKASVLYKQASNMYSQFLSKAKNIDINNEIDIKQLIEYYLYESYDCNYVFHYKNHQFKEAISDATFAKNHINNALEIINKNIEILDERLQEHLLLLKINYVLSSLSIKIKILEPKAKDAFINKNYMEAMDFYNEMNQIQDEIFKYVNTANLEPIYKRIQKGNYYAGKASISNAIAGIYLSKDNPSDYLFEVIKQFIDAHKFIKLAQDINPEWDLYKNGYEITKENIKTILIDNIDNWEKILHEFNDEPILIKVTKEINMLQNQKVDNNINVFLSYSRSNDDIANSLDILFTTKNIQLKRDKRDIAYRQSIKKFMQEVRQSDYCLMIISDEYLKSINCMYEVLEFIKDTNFKERILPLIHENSDIFNLKSKTKYIKYWETKYKKTNKLLKKVEEVNRTEIIEEIKKIENIMRTIGEFLSVLSDINNIVVKKNITIADFEKIYCSIYPNECLENTYSNVEGYFILNVPRTIIEENVLWWGKNNDEYTREMNNAKIFTEGEMKSLLDGINGSKKFSAIPISYFAPKLGQNRIPWDYHFKDIFNKNKEAILGNQNIYLTKEEIDILI